LSEMVKFTVAGEKRPVHVSMYARLSIVVTTVNLC
jgi:hypothetical protein